MTNSDIIAIVAITATVLVSLIGGIASVLINCANNTAKRQETESTNKLKLLELTYAERLKAFSEILAVIQDANGAIDKFHWRYEKENLEVLIDFSGMYDQEVKEKFYACFNTFENAYNRNKLYLPKDIDKLVIQYASDVMMRPYEYRSPEEGDPHGPLELDYEKTKQSFDTFFARAMPKKDKYLLDIKDNMQSFLEI